MKKSKILILAVLILVIAAGGCQNHEGTPSQEPGGQSGGNTSVSIGEVTFPNELAQQTPQALADIKGGPVFTATTKVSDTQGNILYVPGGFGVSEESADTVDGGIVIVNAAKDQEYVWVPVDEESLNDMYQEAAGTPLYGSGREDVGVAEVDVYSKLRLVDGTSEEDDKYSVGIPGSLDLREPDVNMGYDPFWTNYERLGAESLADYVQDIIQEYENVYASTKIFQGFYIGRFELTGSRESSSVARGQAPAVLMDWYDLKKGCLDLVNTEYARSTMIFGNQWDEVISWLVETGDKTVAQVNEDSGDWGRYGAGITADPLPAGSDEAWKANNIYDLAGNCMEWTQEALTDTPRIARGGSFMGSSKQAAATRSHYGLSPDWGDADVSTRPVLYIMG